MPTRSINLKMILDRSENGQSLRQSLWLTHSEVNAAVATIERVLPLCRGRAYYVGDDTLVTTETVQAEALAFARKVQRKNGQSEEGADEDVLAALRQLYEAIVPSVLLDDKGEPLKGNAQKSNAFSGPLMDATSEGFQNIFSKILDPPPSWMDDYEANKPESEKKSIDWLKTDEAQRLQRATGRPPTWVRTLRNKGPWQESFIADQEKKRTDAVGTPTLIRKLKEHFGLLPLFPPPIASRFSDSRDGLTPWDRLSMRLAVAHLLSWESWNHRASYEYRTAQQKQQQIDEHLGQFGSLIDDLREYEASRHEQLMRVTQASDDNPYLIGQRGIRSWERVRETWIQSSCRDCDARVAVLTDFQAKLQGKFGDADLFRWLAANGQEHLWQDQDPLPALVRSNAARRLMNRKREWALYTPPNERLHPRWINYEPKGGSNLRNYGLDIEDSKISLRLRLFVATDRGLAEQEFPIQLAPSGQIKNAAWNGIENNEKQLLFRSSSQQFSASLSGSEVLFDRQTLENRSLEDLVDGVIGPVWFKLVLDVDSKAPADWLTIGGHVLKPPAVHHFNSGLATTSKHTKSLKPGLRVLSVDLGIRDFASCSVFELVRGVPTKGLSFLADESQNLWARHERSFVLNLPGEKTDRAASTARTEAFSELKDIRREVSFLKNILRLSVHESLDERQTAVDALSAETQQSETLTLFNEAMPELKAAISSSQSDWEGVIKKLHTDAEVVVGNRIHTWRIKTRPRNTGAGYARRRNYAGGKSIWSVEYLTAVRRLLVGWSLHGQRYAQIRRGNRAQQGTFAANLLRHINAIKTDRTKAGSDLIIQAARGFVPAKKRGWLQKFRECRLILLEDLARYRFQVDRPRRENSQLMLWNHRQIFDEVTGQAELYGISVETVNAGFTSRFHARTGSPGSRVRTITDEDLKSPWFQQRLEQLADKYGVDLQFFKPGMRIPWEGGEEFATLGRNGQPLILDADLNAAQNLQRRFWTRHGDAYRISAMEIDSDGVSLWYPLSNGSRLRGALGTLVGGQGYARLVPAEGEDQAYILQRITSEDWRSAVRGTEEPDDDRADSADDLLINELLEQASGRKVFFRDPSGTVLRDDRWYETKVFWGRVNRRVASALGITAKQTQILR